jgi:hypothetical protein
MCLFNIVFSVTACSQPVLGILPCPVEKYFKKKKKKTFVFFYHFFTMAGHMHQTALPVPAIQCYPGIQAQSRPSVQAQCPAAKDTRRRKVPGQA